MRALRKAADLLVRCATCRGSGRLPFYVQGCNDILDRAGRRVASTECTTFKACTDCGGSGRRH